MWPVLFHRIVSLFISVLFSIGSAFRIKIQNYKSHFIFSLASCLSHNTHLDWFSSPSLPALSQIPFIKCEVSLVFWLMPFFWFIIYPRFCSCHLLECLTIWQWLPFCFLPQNIHIQISYQNWFIYFDNLESLQTQHANL